MDILVVETNPALRRLWVLHLVRQGLQVAHVATDEDAIAYLSDHDVSLIVLNLELAGGSAIAVSDYASYRRPNARVMFVTNDSFFSDGSIFNHCQNACALVPQTTEPADLAAMAEHYSR